MDSEGSCDGGVRLVEGFTAFKRELPSEGFTASTCELPSHIVPDDVVEALRICIDIFSLASSFRATRGQRIFASAAADDVSSEAADCMAALSRARSCKGCLEGLPTHGTLKLRDQSGDTQGGYPSFLEHGEVLLEPARRRVLKP